MAKLKKINGHVRFIFAYRDVKTSMFIMLDDGRVFMEIFNSKRTDDYSAIERIHSFNKKMSKYLIDERTDIVYTSDYAHYEDPKHNNTDIVFNLLHTIYQHTNSSFRYVDPAYIVIGLKNSFKCNEILPKRSETTLRKKFAKQTGRNTRSFCVITRYINTSYEYILRRKLCHWINDEFTEAINLMSKAACQRLKVLSVGLFYLCVTVWNRKYIKNLCGYDQQFKNYVLKNIKLVDND
jgi:hypothetical protein